MKLTLPPHTHSCSNSVYNPIITGVFCDVNHSDSDMCVQHKHNALLYSGTRSHGLSAWRALRKLYNFAIMRNSSLPADMWCTRNSDTILTMRQRCRRLGGPGRRRVLLCTLCVWPTTDEFEAACPPATKQNKTIHNFYVLFVVATWFLTLVSRRTGNSGRREISFLWRTREMQIAISRTNNNVSVF